MKGRPRKGFIPHDKWDDVVEYYTVLYKSLMDIAKVFEVSTYSVKEVLLEKGVVLRKRGEFMRNKAASNPKEVIENSLTTPLGE